MLIGKDIILRVDNFESVSTFLDEICRDLGVALDDESKADYLSDIKQLEEWLSQDEEGEQPSDVAADDSTSARAMIVLLLRNALLRVITQLPVGVSVYLRKSGTESVVLNFSASSPGQDYIKLI
jgi:hypothetical protein